MKVEIGRPNEGTILPLITEALGYTICSRVGRVQEITRLFRYHEIVFTLHKGPGNSKEDTIHS